MLSRRLTHAAFIVAMISTSLALTISPALADGNCYLDPSSGKIVCAISQTSAGSAPTVVASLPANDGSGSAPAGGAEGVAATAGAASDNPGQIAGECAWRVLNPQPPAGDKLWEGHSPTTGVVLYNLCNGPIAYAFAASAAAAPPPLPPPDPALLAQQAYAELVTSLSKPTVGRSPDPNHGDPAKAGQAYTIVNLWTRYFTDPATFKTMSRTKSLRGVSVTVSAVPTALIFAPGDGNASVSCEGPGSAWSEADGFGPPTAGECGYQYKAVQATPITATESISWMISWTDPAGRTHSLPTYATATSSQLIVEQIQIVVKN